MKRITKYLILTVLAVAMMSSAAVAFAQSDPAVSARRGGPGGQGIGGEVTAVSGDTISVESPRGTGTIVTGDETEFTVNGESGNLANIEVGMFVRAKGERTDDSVAATHVFASSERPTRAGKRGIGGEVIAVSGDTISVENPRATGIIVTSDETEFTVNGESGSLANIKVGMFVRAKGERTDDSIAATHVFASDEAPPRPANRPDRGQ